MPSWRDKVYAAMGQTPPPLPPEPKEAKIPHDKVRDAYEKAVRRANAAKSKKPVKIDFAEAEKRVAAAAADKLDFNPTAEGLGAGTVLTDAQVENWRKVLCGMLGPWALVMPREDIVKIRDRFAARVKEIPDAQG